MFTAGITWSHFIFVFTSSKLYEKMAPNTVAPSTPVKAASSAQRRPPVCPGAPKRPSGRRAVSRLDLDPVKEADEDDGA